MKTLTKIFSLALVVFALSSFESEQKDLTFNAINTTISKSIQKLEFENITLYKVSVKIKNASDIKGIAKFEELIPSGFTVTNMFTDFGKAVYDSERAKVTFLSLNGRSDVNITYFLKGELPIAPNGDSKFWFERGDKIETIAVLSK